MWARCPDCTDADRRAGRGCKRCVNGYVKTTTTGGKRYTRHCGACGRDNGVRVDTGEWPRNEWPPPGKCVWCGSEQVTWEEV